MPDNLRIGTRKSPLAVFQAKQVSDLIQKNFPEFRPELCLTETTGDLIQDRPLYEIGGKDLFLKELETALKEKKVDLAVHSLKDVSGKLKKEFMLPLVLPRENPADALVCGKYSNLEDLPTGAKIGTTSLRRKQYLQKLRPDCQTLTIRGNLETRLRKLDSGEFDALILAVSGLTRGGYVERIAREIPVQSMIPAVGQGVIAVECLAENSDLIEKLQSLDCENTRVQVECERAFLSTMNGNCRSPLGALAQIRADKIHLISDYFSLKTGRQFSETGTASISDAEDLGIQTARKILTRLTPEETAELFSE